jgi:hypothetical protein
MGDPLDVDRFWCQLAWRLYQRSLMVARSLSVTAGPVTAIRRGTVRRRWPGQAGPCRTSPCRDLQPRFARRRQTASQRRLQLPQAACRVAVERWRRQDRCGPAAIAVHRGEGDPVIRVDTVYLHEAREPPRSGKAMLDLQKRRVEARNSLCVSVPQRRGTLATARSRPLRSARIRLVSSHVRRNKAGTGKETSDDMARCLCGAWSIGSVACGTVAR